MRAIIHNGTMTKISKTVPSSFMVDVWAIITDLKPERNVWVSVLRIAVQVYIFTNTEKIVLNILL